jgi:hypothetical protein
MTIFNDPERWSRRTAGSVHLLIFMTICHLVVWSLPVASLLLFQRIWPMYHALSPWLPYLVLSLFFVAVFLPALYLYAMFRLLKRIDELKSEISVQKAGL